jgi:hypothetical protein
MARIEQLSVAELLHIATGSRKPTWLPHRNPGNFCFSILAKLAISSIDHSLSPIDCSQKFGFPRGRRCASGWFPYHGDLFARGRSSRRWPACWDNGHEDNGHADNSPDDGTCRSMAEVNLRQGSQMASQLELSARAALCRQLAKREPTNRVLWMAEAENWSRLSNEKLRGEAEQKSVTASWRVCGRVPQDCLPISA